MNILLNLLKKTLGVNIAPTFFKSTRSYLTNLKRWHIIYEIIKNYIPVVSDQLRCFLCPKMLTKKIGRTRHAIRVAF